MAEFIAFKCDDCGERIEDLEMPLVVKEVVGPAPGAAAVLDLTDAILPRRVRAVVANPRQNMHRCVTCRAWEYGEDLVDKDGNVVVAFADHADRTTFAAALTTAVAARQAALAAPATP